jgi:two-component system sensor histidine kinase DegS
LLLKATEKKLAQKHLPEVKETRKVLALVDTVINHTHDLAHCFSSMDLQGDDLCFLIKKLSTSVKQTFPVVCRFQAVGVIPVLPAEMTAQLYKIVQESISNAIKHAKAKKVLVSLARQRGKLILQVKNDGVPFPIERAPSRRMGLRIMNYRAQTLGGTFDIRPNGRSGALVTCSIPFVNGHKSPAKKNGLAPIARRTEITPDLVAETNPGSRWS